MLIIMYAIAVHVITGVVLIVNPDAGASTGQILAQMAGIMSRCTTCHDLYRFTGQ